jgi:hypothetical protein
VTARHTSIIAFAGAVTRPSLDRSGREDRMKAKTRRKLEMGARALIFSRLHPDPSPGSVEALARLEDYLARATHLEGQQREGMLDVHSATARKRDLSRLMRRAHLAHLRYVARIAERDLPELEQLFRLKRGTIPYRTFRTAARSMADEAVSRKDVLIRHGLADTVLESLSQALDEFDQVVEQGNRGRLAHVGASADLDLVADEVVLTVKVMNGLNHSRFAHQPELLAAWRSVSHVVAAPRSAGDVRPAA